MKVAQSEADQLAFFDGVRERFETAVAAVGAGERFYSVAGTTIRVRFAGERLVPILGPALEHNRVEGVANADVTLCVWDSQSTGVAMLSPPCAPEQFTDRGDVWGFDSARIRTAFHWSEYSVNLMDLERNLGIYWVDRVKALPYWVAGAPLRTLLHWWMERCGAQLLHAAAVGTEDGAVLITGKGGIGKSTTALACLRAGLRYVADDYLAVSLDPEPRVHSLYCTAKLNADQVQKFPELVSLIANPGFGADEKALFFLHPEFREQVVRDLPLRALLLPEFHLGRTSDWAEAGPHAATQAACFTSLSQLPGAGPQTYAFAQQLAHRLPAFALRLGEDLGAVPEAIVPLLDGKSSRAAGPAIHRTGVRAQAPLVSVIVPVHNGERFLREAIENIVSQDYPALEIIVVDDGSTDATAEVARALTPDVRFLQKNRGGPASARNWGIRDSSAELLAFLDVDDLWPRGNLHRLVEELHRDTEFEVVHGWGQLMRWDQKAAEYASFGTPEEGFPYYIGAGLYRKAAFRKVGLFDASLRFGEDTDWYVRAQEEGVRIRRLAEITLSVRRHEANMTRGRDLVELNTLRVFKNALDRRRARKRA